MSDVQEVIKAVHEASIDVDASRESDTLDEVFEARDGMQDTAQDLLRVVERLLRTPAFAPESEPDALRDLWNANMPRVSGCMYFAIPGEQPIHVNDEAALHILTYLSEQNR